MLERRVRCGFARNDTSSFAARDSPEMLANSDRLLISLSSEMFYLKDPRGHLNKELRF